MESASTATALRIIAPGIACRLTAILVSLATLVARAFLRDPRRIALIVPLWSRLTRAARRFDRLMARLAAGTLPRPTRPGRSGSRPHPLPSGNGWLLAALRHEGAGCAAQLGQLLAEPETAAILAQIPQAGRILRPICRMLGLHPAALPPPSPRKPIALAPAQAPITHPEPRLPPLAATAPSCPRTRWPWFPRPVAIPV